MADYIAPVPTTSATESRQPPVNAALVVYILFAIAAVAGLIGHGMLVGAPLLTLVGIVGVIVAYITRGDGRGTWIESHLTWLIRTFWWSLLWNCLGWLVAVTVIGLPLAMPSGSRRRSGSSTG
jgi:Predicted membrane protein